VILNFKSLKPKCIDFYLDLLQTFKLITFFSY